MEQIKTDLNEYIKRSHINAVEKFNKELLSWAHETGEEQPTLYEDANTSFTLANVHVENGWLKFDYDGQPDSALMVEKDDLEGLYYETEGIDGIMEYIKFWRSCLRRARRYWNMDPDKLDDLQDGYVDDIEEEED